MGRYSIRSSNELIPGKTTDNYYGLSPNVGLYFNFGIISAKLKLDYNYLFESESKKNTPFTPEFVGLKFGAGVRL